jgi:hypothetical protein
VLDGVGDDLMQRNLAQVGDRACMFHGECNQVTVCVKVDQGVFVDFTSFIDRAVAELQVEGVRVAEVSDFHGFGSRNLRSKKAL